jgi:hypothetical protein
MSLVKRPRADADEGDAIAMARIHVRLDLEDEAGEALVGRLTMPVSLGRGCGCGASSTSVRRNGSRPKLVIALPKNTGVCRPAGTRDVEPRAGGADHVERLAEVGVGVLADQLARVGVVESETSTGARYCPCISRS